MKKDGVAAKKSSASRGSGNKASDNKAAPGVKKQGTKHLHGRQGGRLPTLDKHRAAARALLRGSGLTTDSLSSLLDQTVDELQDKNIKCLSSLPAARQGTSLKGGEPPLRQSHPPAAPPPTPAGKSELAGSRHIRYGPNDATSVLESLSSWGL